MVSTPGLFRNIRISLRKIKILPSYLDRRVTFAFRGLVQAYLVIRKYERFSNHCKRIMGGTLAPRPFQVPQ